MPERARERNTKEGFGHGISEATLNNLILGIEENLFGF